MIFEPFLTTEGLMALVTLTLLEIVLGIDNIIFISILCGKLPVETREKARKIGLFLAMFMRIGLLIGLSWVMGLTAPLFTMIGNEISGRDLILIVGGLFLMAKSTREIHHKLEGESEALTKTPKYPSFTSIIIQIILIDIVFSLDSVITAVGMAQHVSIMIVAVVLSVGFMMFFAKWIGDFVDRHPTIKMLALSFLLMIGMVLIADGFGHHIPKGYIYTAMAFSMFVESLNIRMYKKRV